MPSGYEKALTELYQAPLESFIAERARLAAELDKADAKRLAKAARPPISAWAVNQLWWHARADFEELLETAAQLRKGKLTASSAHRQALTKLTARAQKLLGEAGHGFADATRRRISMTLAALAAAGGFEPELPGTLSKDRDPPGFEAFGIPSTSDSEEEKPEQHTPTAASKHEPKSKPTPKSKAKDKRAQAELKRHAAAEAKKEREAAAARAAKARQAAAEERARVAEERAKEQAKRSQLSAAVRDAKHELSTAERQAERARRALEQAEAALAELGADD